jgi:excisionase family DNA binding protein
MTTPAAKRAVSGPFEPDCILTYAEAAEPIGVSERMIRRWVADGRLPFIQLPRGRRLRGSAVNAFLAECDREN